MTVASFYDDLSPFYHLVFPDWEASIERQAAALRSIVKEVWGDAVNDVLDVACGIGTQAIGLSRLGYSVTGSDVSPGAIERARKEAAARGLKMELSVADMRQASSHHGRQFDLVVACDNAVPHLLTDEEILAAFRELYACVRPGGGCLITVRDYDQEERTGTQVKPYGVRVQDGKRYVIFQVWDYEGAVYDLAMYFIEDGGEAGCRTHVMRSRYYAVGTATLVALMAEAGFSEVRRLDGRFYQPVIVGTRPGSAR